MTTNFKDIEKKWFDKWEGNVDLYRTEDDFSKEKKYVLVEFPYPSGSGLHIGHTFSFTGADVYARIKRMQGLNVLFPMGWDAFGLPTENYAIKTKRKPQDVTKENTDMFRSQMKKLAFSFDWNREVNTTDPRYYKWTQWIFIKLFEKGLAEKKEMPINWCPSCKIGLANEEVIDGKCERCGAETSRRNISQWIVKITDYADKLVEGLEKTAFIEKVKQSQINWIGKSEGAKIKFALSPNSISILQCSRPSDDCALKTDTESVNTLEVFTTRPDTIFGATFMVVAPEHKIVSDLILQCSRPSDDCALKIDPETINKIKEYLTETRKKSDLERQELTKEKTGVFSGLYAINPATGKEIPIWISDFVLASYGTGAIMSVPAHDQRDHEFAKKFGLPITQVVAMDFFDKKNPPRDGKENTIRNGVIVIVKHWSEDKYIQLRWKNHDWQDLITGGIENGEDPLEAAKREVIEETGYQNIKSVEYIPFEHVDHFFAAHKDVNRVVKQKNIVVQLADGTFVQPTDEESGMFDVVWLSKEEMLSTINLDNHKYVFETYLKNGQAYTEDGIVINSDFLNGLDKKEAFEKMCDWLKEKGLGEKTSSYHLRDWIFSRQHYWGEPIPMVKCEKCGWVPVKEKDLPIVLPEVEHYEPTDDGQSPLSQMTDWVKTTCPCCGELASRETDTMPNWAGSDWYFLAYVFSQKMKDSQSGTNDTFVDIFSDSKNELKYWGPVDVYVGGDEHNVLHLLYSRFIYKFLYDLGVLPENYPEPYFKRLSHGVILGPDGARMSKSKGNVIVPEVVADKYGVDVVRMYLMFMGPFDATMAWNENTLMGVKRFLDRLDRFYDENRNNTIASNEENYPEFRIKLNKTIKKFTQDLEQFKYNTAIAAMMELLNLANDSKGLVVSQESINKMIQIMAPIAPYISEEWWSWSSANTGSVHASSWPKYDEKYLIEENLSIAVAVNGKVRGQLNIESDMVDDESRLIELALNSEKIKPWIEGKQILKKFYVKGKMVNLVVG